MYLFCKYTQIILERNQLMNIVYDFLEGRTSYQTFIDQLYADDAIFDWFQSMVSDDMLKDQSFRCSNSLDREGGSF